MIFTTKSVMKRKIRKENSLDKEKQKASLVQYPFSEPDAISARRRSQALRWVNPKCLTIFAHWVPFQLPGPPVHKLQMNERLAYDQAVQLDSTN